MTVPGTPPERLPAEGKRFLREFGKAVVERGQIGAPEAAQAAEVLLDSIERSDGSRASVVEALFATKVENGILGSFAFDRFGDVVPASVGIYRSREVRSSSRASSALPWTSSTADASIRCGARVGS